MPEQVALTLEETAFQLGGPDPIWIWGRACFDEACGYRSTLVAATTEGREALLERAAIAEEAWRAGVGQREIAGKLVGSTVFTLDIDSVEAFPGRGEIELDENRDVRAVVERLDGRSARFDWPHRLPRQGIGGSGAPSPGREYDRGSGLPTRRLGGLRRGAQALRLPRRTLGGRRPRTRRFTPARSAVSRPPTCGRDAAGLRRSGRGARGRARGCRARTAPCARAG